MKVLSLDYVMNEMSVSNAVIVSFSYSLIL